MSKTVIQSVDPGSPAQRAGILPGETLLTVNGHPIVDVLDYKYHTYDPDLVVELEGEGGRVRTVSLQKEAGEDMGLNFETYLMDAARSCANHCIFCFVDQMPKNMRETLYFKDDDARLSFLMGNYITLTNLSEREVQRIIDLKVSPINISVHATNPELRALLLGSPRAGKGLEIMERFAKANITMNCQIVACPGINDGEYLRQTMSDLAALYPAVNTVSVVPVGLTKHRANLYPLEPYTRESAGATLDLVEGVAQSCLKELDSRVFWCSDEFYLKAGRPLPPDAYYEDYTQLENGVGMLRLLETEFHGALTLQDPVDKVSPFSIATGVAAAPFLREIVDRAAGKCHNELDCRIYPVVNRFFGETIDVAGLVTGGDLIRQLRGKPLGRRLLLPVNMLRHGQNVFLDDVTLPQVEEALGVPVVTVEQDGFDLCDKIFEENG